MKIRRGLKRIGAVALAAILVVGSVNLSGIVANADNEGSGDPSINPYYNNEKYVYNGYNAIGVSAENYYGMVFEGNGDFKANPYDVFGAATHVHLFAEDTIKSTVHTHGNIFCNTANLGEVGTRVQNNTLMNTIPGYREESYISGKVTAINGSSDFDTLILGKDIGLELQDNGHRRAVEVRPERGSNYYVKLDNTDPRYIFKESGSTAINFVNEFAYLRYLSSQWAGMGNSDSVNYSSSDSNGKITISGWNGETNLYYNMSYADWIKNSNGITITGMDTTQTNRGILVINIDMKGVTATSITLGGNPTVGTFSNKEYKTDQYGQCRIVYNIVDTSAQNNQYTGELQFGNTVFGSILAPSANITVGAVNGTVMARSITHEGQESHRMDIWALSTETKGEEMPSTTPNTDGENGENLALRDIENSFGPINNPTKPNSVNIIIHKTYGDKDNLDSLPQDLDQTVFALYKTETDAGVGGNNHFATGSAKRIDNNNEYAEVVISLKYEELKSLCGDSSSGTIPLFIKEIHSSDGYEISSVIYQYKITFTKNGDESFTVTKCEYVDVGDKEYFECNNSKTTTSTDDNKPDGGDDSKPDGGDDSKPDGGDDSKPDGGDDSKPDGGDDSKPDGGDDSKPDGGDDSKPDGGDDSKPDGGDDSKPDGGDDSTSGSGDDSKPEDNNTSTSDPEKPSSTPDVTTPSTPSTPSTPTTPSTPSTPSTPTTTPGTPSTPNTWETPDGKVHFEILIEYEHIDSSSKPERIEELITNTTIKIVDKDGNDVTENVTKITWDPSRDVAIVTVEVPKPSEGFDTYYVIESTDPADNDLSHSEPGKGFTVAVTSDAKVLFQEDGSATPTTELRFVNVEGATDTITNTATSMTSPQTGERKLPWTVLGGGMSMIFIAGTVYVFRKKEKIEE